MLYPQLTVLSPWYLQMAGKLGGEEVFAQYLVPEYIRSSLVVNGLIFDPATSSHVNSNSVTPSRELIFRGNISQMGDFLGTPSTSRPGIADVSLAAWLNLDSTVGPVYAAQLASLRGNLTFTAAETSGVYRLLTNVTLFGGHGLQTSDTQTIFRCMASATRLCNDTYYQDEATGPGDVPENDVYLYNVSNCGVVYIFQKCQSSYLTSQSLDVLQESFCASNDACLNFTDAPGSLQEVYFNMLQSFIKDMSGTAMDRFRSSASQDIVIAKAQIDLALGYRVFSDKVKDTHFSFSNTGHLTEEVPGFLSESWLLGQHRVTDKDINPVWSMYTCLRNRDMNNNMVVKNYGSHANVPQSLLLNSFGEPPSIHGHTDYVPACYRPTTCVTCPILGDTVQMFVEQLHRPVDFRYTMTSDLSGVTVYRYSMDSGELEV